MVLCRGADESHTADVDVFDGISIGDIWPGNSLFEWIEVDGDEIDIIPAKVEKLPMVFIRRTSQQSAMDGGMQCLDASAQNFWRPGIVRNFSDGDPVLA